MGISPNRRAFLQTSSSLAVGCYLGSGLRTRETLASDSQSANEQPVVGFIGTGIRYHTYHGHQAPRHASVGGIADVDWLQGGRAQQVAMEKQREAGRPIVVPVYEDYRHLLDRQDIDVVVIGSVDHWHTKQVIDALNAGKDVYCEKPVTLTIREGQQIEEALKKTDRVLQVGTQQRTEYDQKFVTAAAMMRDNRVGDIQRVTACIGGSRESGVLPVASPPKSLNWEMWLGQAPLVDYRSAAEVVDQTGWGAGHPFSRAHRYYRWFYEYSGGKLTDWGAHNVDVAMWGLNRLGDDEGPITIEPADVVHPVPLDDRGMPTRDDQFNCALSFNVKCTFHDGVVMMVRDRADDLGFDNGVMFEGTQGRYLVNRGKLVGAPVEALESNPLAGDAYQALYADPEAIDPERLGKFGYHMENFFDCVKSRKTPASDIVSHNRMLNVCHAVNIAMRLGRTVTYHPQSQDFGDDELANSFIERQQRKGYEIKVGT